MTPSAVRRAVLLIWVSLGIAGLTSLGSRLAGLIDSSRFYGELLVYAALSIFPYKMAKGSNAARIAFFVMIAVSLAWMLAGGYATLNKLELAIDILQLGLTISIVILLMRKDSADWFMS